MSYQSRTKFTNIAVYSLLGIIIAAVIAVSVITFTTAKRKTPSVTTPVQTNAPDTSKTTETPKQTSAPKTTPAQTDAGNKPQPTPTPTKTDELPAGNDKDEQFTQPVKGYVMKSHSVDLPVFSLTTNDYRIHCGIDISAPEGTGVCAIANGTVSKIYDDPMKGKTVEINHDGSITSRYSNLASELAEGIIVGANVGEGQIIGAVGSSSLVEIAESDHLHFELQKGYTYLDPMKFFDYSTTPVTDVPGLE